MNVMALWLYRAGKHGEHEQKFLNDGRIYLTWEQMDDHDLTKGKQPSDIKSLLRAAMPDASEGRIIVHSGQISAFISAMKPGDWVVMPLKSKPAIAVGEITNEFVYDPKAPSRYRLWRGVKWLNQDVPRSAFDQDLLYSFGAIQTLCQIQRNDAEKRVRKMAENKWITATPAVTLAKQTASDTDGVEEAVDLERLGRDDIAKLILRKFKGFGMERLVEAILKAQGYTTYRSPEGADKGIDILAAPGALGFGRPRICVQVKSQQTPVDRPTLDQLIGAMQNVQADQGLLVSWGGFKQSVYKEIATQFFRVRLWDQDDLINELLEHYHQLDEDLRAELPLKRIWSVASPDASE
jgi:restriction system protein